MKTAPKFKVGDKIQFSPTLRRKFKIDYTVWKVTWVDEEGQFYLLLGESKTRALKFNLQGKYRKR